MITDDVEHQVHENGANAGYAQHVKSELKDLLELDPAKVIPYPRYHLTTTRGRDVVIATYAWGQARNKTPLYPETTDTQRTFMIALDADTGVVVGHRFAAIAPTGDIPYSMGALTVRDENEGIATALEMAHQYYLIQLADELGTTVGQYVTDHNAYTLTQLELDYEKAVEAKSDQQAEIYKKLLAKRVERDRWKALYATGGKFGVDENGIKTTPPPNEKPAPLEALDIYLKREDIIDEYGVSRISVSASERPVANGDEAPQDNRLIELRDNILPQLHSIIANQ